MPVVTIPLRSLVAFAAGVAVALIAIFALQSWRADAADQPTDTTFVPVTPCRLLDTRPAPDHVGAPVFSLHQSETIALPTNDANGVGNCSDLRNWPAQALSLNVTAIDPSDPTFLTFWPAATPQPLSSSLNPTPGEPPTPNAVVVGYRNGFSNGFNVYNHRGSLHLVIDVNGYYTNTTVANLQARVNALESRSKALTASAYTDTSNNVTDYETVLTLHLVPSTFGKVVLNYHATVFEPDVGEWVTCFMGGKPAGNVGLGNAYSQTLTSNGSYESLAGTFEWYAGPPSSDYELRCSSSNGAQIVSAYMTAVFIPN
jgi:hypothetical protein